MNPKTWMRDLPPQARSKPLKELAIPGSHDCGAYELDESGPLAPSITGAVRFFANCCCCCGKKVVKNWSITQDLDIKGQLELGMRYLDIRTAYKADIDDFNIVHGLYGVLLNEVFTQVKAFADQNPTEVIILDFSQFYSFTSQLHQRFAQSINALFGNRIARASQTNGANSTLNSLASSSFQFIVIYHEATTAGTYDFWPGSEITTAWPNTASTTTLVNSLNARFNSLTPNALNIFSAVLSPQTSTVIFHPCGTLKTTLSVDANNAVEGWLQQVKANNRSGVNIVNCDFIELSQWGKLTIELNTM